MQNYREASHPHHEVPRERGFSRPDLRQVLAVALAGVLVAMALAAVALIGARLDPGGADCIMTDNAGCVADPTPQGQRSEVGSVVLPGAVEGR